MPAADNITTLDQSTFAALSKNVLNSKARKLIHDDAVKDSKVIAERQRDRSNFVNKTVKSYGDAYDNMSLSYETSSNRPQEINEEVGKAGVQYDEMLDARMNKLRESVNKQTMENQSILPNQNNNPNPAANFLPKEIVESFKNKEIDTEKLNPNRSVLDNLGVTNGYKDVDGQSISEGENHSSEVNYGLIKQIVESAVKKYAVALNKRMINESKSVGENVNELKAMKIGNKFSFIDGNGNIYEAKLKFVKNIKDK